MDKLQAIFNFARIVVISANPDIREKLRVNLKVRSGNLFFLETQNSMKKELIDPNTFLILVIQSSTELQNKLQDINCFNLAKEQILLLAPKELEREIQTQQAHSLYFLNPDDLAVSLMHFWEKRLGAILDDTLERAHAIPILGKTEVILAIPPKNSEARARLAYALATQITEDFDLIERVILLSLFYPVIALPGWQEIASANEELAKIIPLLEQKILLGKISLSSSCPQDLSLELLIVECALFAQEKMGRDEKSFRHELKLFSAQLPFRLRTQIRNAVDRSFKYLWKDYEAA